MKKLLGFLSGVMCLGIAANVASAGPNAGGTLIVHGDPGVVYTTDIIDYTGFAPLPDGCESALTNYPADRTFVWWVKAAFPDGSSPRLAGVTFGIDYPADGSVVVVAFGASGDFELPDGSWPAPQSGTAVTFQTARTSQLVDLYWFAGYNYSYYGADVSFDLIPNPSQGANFADDAVPSNLDPIAGLGSLGFGSNPGTLPCPVAGTPEGACCFEDGTCQVLTADDCALAGGAYQGDDTVCDPNPCPQPPATGACCVRGELDCIILSQQDCLNAGGDYLGDDVPCDPDPCPKPGACCFEDGSCVVLEGVDCNAAGGSYQGDNTLCDPNPCPQPTGACCFEDGSCQSLTAAECGAGGGSYQGDNVPCDPNPCPQPPATGACCFEDGSCQVLTADDCGAAGGSYQGDDTVCDPNPCPVVPTIESSWGQIKNVYR